VVAVGVGDPAEQFRCLYLIEVRPTIVVVPRDFTTAQREPVSVCGERLSEARKYNMRFGFIQVMERDADEAGVFDLGRSSPRDTAGLIEKSNRDVPCPSGRVLLPLLAVFIEVRCRYLSRDRYWGVHDGSLQSPTEVSL
jgi:hypothetical protein